MTPDRQDGEQPKGQQATPKNPMGVHLVGSVPLPDAETVFRRAQAALGDRLRRIPDGETGDRSRWVGWQGFAFKALPQFEKVAPRPDQYPPTPRFRVREGADISRASFGNLGYADEALASYRIFTQLRDDGVLGTDQRFQVSIPTPIAPVAMFIVDDAQLVVEPIYERQLLDEVGRILDGIPHDDLAFQWDVCIEMWMWERWLPAPFENVEDEIATRLVRLTDAIPDAVEVGHHLCYGDFQHEHMRQPTDAANLAAVAAAIARSRRPVQWLHLPVPIERDDEAYFAPLRGMSLRPETELYLGLVHFRDGVDGAQRRIAAARQAGVREFGVATECGMGRRPPDRGGTEDGLAELLATHAGVSASVR